MPTTRHRGIVMQTEEQLLRNKIEHLEDRMKVMEKSLSRVNNILGRFQMTENNDSGFKDIDTGTHDHELI
jgi:hypothetical protein